MLIEYLWANSDWIPIYINLYEIVQIDEPKEFLKHTLKAQPFDFLDEQI